MSGGSDKRGALLKNGWHTFSCSSSTQPASSMKVSKNVCKVHKAWWEDAKIYERTKVTWKVNMWNKSTACSCLCAKVGLGISKLCKTINNSKAGGQTLGTIAPVQRRCKRGQVVYKNNKTGPNQMEKQEATLLYQRPLPKGCGGLLDGSVSSGRTWCWDTSRHVFQLEKNVLVEEYVSTQHDAGPEQSHQMEAPMERHNRGCVWDKFAAAWARDEREEEKMHGQRDMRDIVTFALRK